MFYGRDKYPGRCLVEASGARRPIEEVCYMRESSDASAPRLEIRRVPGEARESVGDRVEEASPVEIALSVNRASWASGVNVYLPRRRPTDRRSAARPPQGD